MSSQEPGTSAPDLPGPVPRGATPAAPGPRMVEPIPERSGGRDWTFEVTDRIDSVVGAVRSKTTEPITKVARAVVFGLIAATGGIIALVMFVIGLNRLIDVYLPVQPYARRVWIVYAGLGAIFLVIGLFLWTKRKARTS